MICFPNAKINIGLRVTSRRPDGFHDIETVFYPVFLQDVLEAVPAEDFSLHLSGIPIDGRSDDNLVARAWRLMAEEVHAAPMDVYLHKAIPFGAGLGGGSADAAFLLKLINEAQGLGLDDKQLEQLAARLGADCSFFIRNRPVYAYGKGECLESIDLSLKGCFLLLVKPDVHVSTAEAYRGVMDATRLYLQQHPEAPWKDAGAASAFHSTTALPDFLCAHPVEDWKDFVVNDFEHTVFPLHPEIAAIKQRLYDMGACYASMSGSGSSVFGIFKERPQVSVNAFPDCFTAVEALRF